VGELVKIAVERGRRQRPDLKLGICGEHGGDPASVRFCARLGLDYVSCSPFRVPIARLGRGPGGAVRDRLPLLMPPTESGKQALQRLKSGGKPAIAAALADLERHPETPSSLALLDAAFAAPSAHVVGLTGPPGVGKSTLAGVLIRLYRKQGRRVAVIAVDPSSRRSGGALLGDRTRLAHDPEDDGIFVRSMAARDRLGGLAELTIAAMVPVARAL